MTSQGLQDARLRRLEAALAEGRAREEAFIAEWVRHTGRMPSRKVRRKWEKKWRREAKRAARRAEREAREARSRDPVRGGMYATVAVTCVLMALAQPRRLWWLVFVSLVFFLLAARHLGRPRRGVSFEPEPRPSMRGAEPRGAEGGPGDRGASVGAAELRGTENGEQAEAGASPHGARSWGMGHGVGDASHEADARRTEAHGSRPSTGAAVDPRVAKVDVLCGKLLAELREGPAVLREVVHAPERTVEALRKSCHELARREQQLRALSTPEETRRLESEREALAARVSAEQDAVVRERLTGALAALDEQRRQRAELATAADRLEAEHTRLYYTLEGLYAQVLRVRSADTVGEDVAGAGLRRSVEQLGAEVEAVTQALEEVHRAPDGRTRTR
ncbi:hypothetical protein [Myxococcus sp. RHSTA-1-4]|uniref:hypothetical protein n=1 Tax=Myxococcus sp. RHSTA-1-4 TaxID=2874601 RepID=UPI001CBE3E29|nr:hypothetical protein [Myxococcus sp. RHSTA-1-4]